MKKRMILAIFIFSLLLLTSCTVEEPRDMITGDFRFIDLFTRASSLECSDSDKGINLEKKGTASILKDKAHFPLEIKTDYCRRDGKLTEFYCSRGEIKNKIISCNDECIKGECVNIRKINTLVIINTDVYTMTKEEIELTFKIAEDYWLFPKTNTKFNITGIIFISFEEKCPNFEGFCDQVELLNNYFHEEKNPFPEYIVIFNNQGSAGINGGTAGKYELYWLDPEMGSFYEPNSSQKFCTKFQIPNFPTQIPKATINWGHKFALCGYNENKTMIISDKGLCQGKETNCIWQNGYQMCENLKDSFFAKNKLYLTSKIIVHELLHSYAEDPIEMEHFNPSCGYETLGWDPEIGSDYYENLNVAFPFDDLFQEYAMMCPYVWQQFINSGEGCSND